MTTNYINILLSFCLLLSSVVTTQAGGPKSTKEKTIKASYTVQVNDLLEVVNKYGNIELKNHQGSTVELEAHIKAWDGSDKKAQATLDRITIERAQNGNSISFKTVINHENSNHISLTSSKGFAINYILKIPEHMQVNIENGFGNVSLENALGGVDIDVKHGNLDAGRLGEGKVNVKFGNTAIKGFEGAASVKSKHGNLKIGNATRLEIDQAHGHLELGASEQLKGKIEHGNANIKSVATALDWKSEFGNFNLGRTSAQLTKIALNVKHGNANIGFDKSAKFDWSAKTEFGNIQQSVGQMQLDKGHTEQSAKGTANGGGSASVKVEVSFGNINLH